MSADNSFRQSLNDSAVLLQQTEQPSLPMLFCPFLAFVAWCLSLIVCLTCENISLDVEIDERPYYLGFGFWNYLGWTYLNQSGTIYYARTCETYGDHAVNFDPKWKTAQAFSILAVVIGAVAMSLNCCIICTVSPYKGYSLFTLLYTCTSLCQGLTLLFLLSNACLNNPIFSLESLPVDIAQGATCELAWGAYTSIAATVLWFATACLMAFIGFQDKRNSSSSNSISKEDVMALTPTNDGDGEGHQWEEATAHNVDHHDDESNVE